MDLEREAEINKDWLTVQNYQFKILVMIAALAQEKLAFRGKLKDMCEFLGVQSCGNNNAKIKEAIAKLEEKGDILVVKQGQVWTLTLSTKAERKPKVIRIKNAWIKAIQQYELPEDEEVSWDNILKVFVFLCADKKDVKTYKEIAAELALTYTKVKRAIHALDNIELTDINFKRKMAYYKTIDNEFKVKGQRIDVIRDFN